MIAALRCVLVAAIAVLAGFASGFGPPTLVESGQLERPVSPATLKAMNAGRPPSVMSRAAVIMDADTGSVVYQNRVHDRRAPASTTKVLTALVTLEKSQLDEIVTAGPDVLVEPTVMGLEPGDRLTVEQLLYGLLLPSGNDVAIALADHVGGSVAAFAEMMNARATELGMKDSHFVTPNGLDAEGHYSSAYDLALLARAALQNPVFARIVRTREYRVPGYTSWVLKNSNQLLASYPGADGVKTGYTDDAGRCLIFSATRREHRAISVVLGSADTWQDSRTLLDYFFANYDWQTLAPPDLPVGDRADGGGEIVASPRNTPEIVYPAWQRPYLRWFFSRSDPSTMGGIAGHSSYYLFGEKVAEIELYAEGD